MCSIEQPSHYILKPLKRGEISPTEVDLTTAVDED